MPHPHTTASRGPACPGFGQACVTAGRGLLLALLALAPAAHAGPGDCAGVRANPARVSAAMDRAQRAWAERDIDAASQALAVAQAHLLCLSPSVARGLKAGTATVRIAPGSGRIRLFAGPAAVQAGPVPAGELHVVGELESWGQVEAYVQLEAGKEYVVSCWDSTAQCLAREEKGAN